MPNAPSLPPPPPDPHNPTCEHTIFRTHIHKHIHTFRTHSFRTHIHTFRIHIRTFRTHSSRTYIHQHTHTQTHLVCDDMAQSELGATLLLEATHMDAQRCVNSIKKGGCCSIRQLVNQVSYSFPLLVVSFSVNNPDITTVDIKSTA